MTATVRLLLTFTVMMALMHVTAGIDCYSCEHDELDDPPYNPSNINCAPPFNSTGISIDTDMKFCLIAKEEYGGMYMY